MPDMTKIKFPGVQAGSFKLDAAEIEVPDESVKGVEGLIQNIYDAAETITTLEADKATLEGEKATLLKQVEDAKEISPEELHKVSEERRQVMDVAEHVGFKKDDLSSITNEDIKAQVVRKDNADTPKDANVDYINGAFGMIQARLDREVGNKQKLGKLGEDTGKRIDKDDVAAAGDSDKTYREQAQERLDGVHALNDEQLREKGFVN